MIVSLVKKGQVFLLTLPSKVEGMYWMQDCDAAQERRSLFMLSAVEGAWHLIKNESITFMNTQNMDAIPMRDHLLIQIQIAGEEEVSAVYAEELDHEGQKLKKFSITQDCQLTIGRQEDCAIRLENTYVSALHAVLSYTNGSWSIKDQNSTNGTYVNGIRVTQRILQPGDMIFIMGFQIIIGSYFIACNKCNQLSIQSNYVVPYHPQEIVSVNHKTTVHEQLHHRVPVFHHAIEPVKLSISEPPQKYKEEQMPIAYVIGPSLTMGLSSLSMAGFTLVNVMNQGGDLMQAAPTLVMAGGMMLGTVAWPILTKKYEKKHARKMNDQRYKDYMSYLATLRDRIREAMVKQKEILIKQAMTVEDAVDIIMNHREELWSYTSQQSGFLEITAGCGELPLKLELDLPMQRFHMEQDELLDAMNAMKNEIQPLQQAPISYSLKQHWIAGMYGLPAACEQMARSLLLQLIAKHGYDQIKLIVLDDESGHWSCVRWLPHIWSDDQGKRFYIRNQEDIKDTSIYFEQLIAQRKQARTEQQELPFYVIFSFRKELAERCSFIKLLLEESSCLNFACITIGEGLQDMPKEVQVLMELQDQQGTLRYPKEAHQGQHFDSPSISQTDFEQAIQACTTLTLPMQRQEKALPRMLTFLELYHVSQIEHLNIWKRWEEHTASKTLQVPVGVDVYGDPFYLDLHEKYHGPHGLIAGMTGSGKSEFIITYILSLAVNFHPDEVAFILIDYKGGGLSDAFVDHESGYSLPHVLGTITNLDGSAVKRSLLSIQSELRRRQAMFAEARRIANEGTMDIYRYQELYRNHILKEPLPHLFIIADEFAELKAQEPEFMSQLISTARIGRSLGVHLILATQKPSGVVDDQIWSNSKFRVCLKVQDRSDSMEMIKRQDAAELVDTGRFYLQVGYDEIFALGQSAWCGAPYEPHLDGQQKEEVSIQLLTHTGQFKREVREKSVRPIHLKKQIVAIVSYLSQLAHAQSLVAKPLWLNELSDHLLYDSLCKKYPQHHPSFALSYLIGEYDDPYNQAQGPLLLNLDEGGNTIVYGSAGSGKTNLLTTLLYAAVCTHDASQINLYVLDYGSESLQMFANAPQVGNVLFSHQEEEIKSLLRMLQSMIEERKRLLSQFGGDFHTYVKVTQDRHPYIIIVINHFAAFMEAMEDLEESFVQLSREANKYGILFIITAAAGNEVRMRIAQNFRQLLCMRMNDETEYISLLGPLDGVKPGKHKGRGIIKTDKVYEFQIALVEDVEKLRSHILHACDDLQKTSSSKAPSVPTIPDRVTCSYVAEMKQQPASLPVGIETTEYQLKEVLFDRKCILPILSSKQEYAQQYVYALLDVIKEKQYFQYHIIQDSSRHEHCEAFVKQFYDDLLHRNHAYKDGVTTTFPPTIYILPGFHRIVQAIPTEARSELFDAFLHMEEILNVFVILTEGEAQISPYIYEDWYKQQIGREDGIWIGSDIIEQSAFSLSNYHTALQDELSVNYGYLIRRGKGMLIKLLEKEREEHA